MFKSSKLTENLVSENLQGFPEFADDEFVSVPDAKYTKGEFEVCLLQLFLHTTV